ncbi:Nucleolar complex-associated protein 3 [Lamellibrachia satsuma]|nr:Nucleolar complex-associated protein 3 [Lamellibrachia satsuma]
MPSLKGKRSFGKRKAYKVSVTKLSNKKLNKLAKQGKLKKGLNKHQLKQLVQQRTHPHQHPHLVEEDEDCGKERPKNEVSDIPLEEADYDYYSTPGRDFSFLSEDGAEEGANRRKRRHPQTDYFEAEETYEKVPRQGTGSDKVMKALLPIKGKAGIVHRTIEMESNGDDADIAMETEAVANGTEPALQEDGEMEEDLPPLSAAELFARRQTKLREKKRIIAMLSSALIENPEQNVKKLKELQLLMKEKDPEIFITVRKLATVSLLEIYKDIIPEYRIRLTTETEKEQSMKTDTKQLLAYEEGLLNHYKTYLERLELMVKGNSGKNKQQKKKRKQTEDIEIPPLAFKEMRRLAVRCLLELLETHPHFNFRTNIIALAVPFMDHRDSELSALVCDYVRQVFREDKEGEVTLEIVRLIGRLVKARKFNVKPAVSKSYCPLVITGYVGRLGDTERTLSSL